MAAADITVDGKWATIESSPEPHMILVKDNMSALTITGSKDVFLSMEPAGEIPVADEQVNGVIKAEPGDTVPIPTGTKFVRHRTKDGEASKMWYIPAMV